MTVRHVLINNFTVMDSGPPESITVNSALKRCIVLFRDPVSIYSRKKNVEDICFLAALPTTYQS